ncbi:MAG: CRISPR-associated protein Cas5 [Peptococcaceae bacterium]|jgi:CRISPR-associated protein Cas5t|nr:CRISPR-associated protein Cas5 [Peptococcaceae bacterium]
MYYFEVDAFAEIAGFRIPETHTFQQTLPLPPPTTLVGLLGAAIGQSFEDAMLFCQQNNIRFGVQGRSQSRFKDLWKYQKIKTDGIISAVLLREMLAGLELYLLVAAEDDLLLNDVREAIKNPVYALTAGNSDNLLKIRKIGPISSGQLVMSSNFEQTVLKGDHSLNFETNIDIKRIPLVKDIYAPMIYLLPTEFEFKGTERRIKARAPYTFVDIPIQLKNPVEAIDTGTKTVALL